MKQSTILLFLFFLAFRGGTQTELELFASFQGTTIEFENVLPENHIILKFGELSNEGMAIDTTFCKTDFSNPFVKSICLALKNEQNIWPDISPLQVHTVHINHAFCNEKITNCSVNYKVFSKEKAEESYTTNIAIENGTIRNVNGNENRLFLAEKLSFQALVVLSRVGIERPPQSMLNKLYTCRKTNFQFRMDINCLAEQLKSFSEAELRVLNERLSSLF